MRVLLLIACLVACNDHREPAAQPKTPTVVAVPAVVAVTPADAAPKPPIGWWRSENLCLELHENGDFELSLTPPDQPKVQIVGTYKASLDGEQWKLELAVAKIWQARFIGKCRRTVINAQYVDEKSALGFTFKPNHVASATLRVGKDAAAFCVGPECTTLKPETPKLGGSWEGDKTRLDLYGPAYVWTLRAGKQEQHGDQTDEVHYVGPDHFALTIAKRPYTVTRLAGERIELCDGSKSCATLDRVFDSDHTDLPGE